MVFSRAWLLSALLLAGSLLAGCSGATGYGSSGTPAAGAAPGTVGTGGVGVVAVAASHTLSATAAARLRLDGAAGFGATRAPVFVNGVFDLATGRGREVIDLPEVGHQEPGTEHAIFSPPNVYLQPRARTGGVLPRGKPWLSVTLAGSDPVTTNFPQFVGQAEGVDPRLLLQELAWGATATTAIRQPPAAKGIISQGYRVTVDLAQALAHAGSAGEAVPGLALQQQLTGPGQRRVTIDAWIDRSGRVVQLSGPPPGTGTGHVLMTFSSFGTPVHIALPTPSQVVDIASLTPSGERENNGGGDSDGG